MGTIDIKLQESTRCIDSLISERPEVGVILGSGWQGFLQEIETPQEIKLSTIPHLFPTWASQRKGALIFGKLSNPPKSPFNKGGKRGITVACLDARLHTYEGFTAQEVAYPVWAMGALGIRILFITNAAGGINRAFPVGSLMLIKDHINIAGEDPTRGAVPLPTTEYRSPGSTPGIPQSPVGATDFVDMSQAYDPELIRVAELTAKKLGIKIRKGVYAGVRGPTYETPAEINMLRILGADAVGMSTIPEVIAARQMGIKVCGISCITNKAAGLSKEKITHEEVLAVMGKVGIRAFKLLREVIISSRRL